MTATSKTDAELIRLALAVAGLAPPDESAALIGQHAADAGDSLVRLVLGARELRRRLAVIEVEAANQARESGITVRRLSEATGISERNIRQRYRRATVEQARP